MEEGDAPAGGAPAPKKEAAPEPTPAPAAEARVSMKKSIWWILRLWRHSDIITVKTNYKSKNNNHDGLFQEYGQSEKVLNNFSALE